MLKLLLVIAGTYLLVLAFLYLTRASTRMEKGYRDYGHDIDNMDDPYSAYLSG